jgi:polyisoprenoid-binding protein YceI
MLNRFAIIVIFFLPYFVKSQTLKPDAGASQIQFTIANFGLDVEGTFSGIAGSILFSGQDPEAALFDLQIPSNSIETGITLRDKHLKNETYFNCEKYPLIRFVSTQVRQAKDGWFEVSGLLTIKGISKPVAFPFQVSQVKERIRLTGKFTINRRDFLIGKNSLTMSDSVNVQVSVTTLPNSL